MTETQWHPDPDDLVALALSELDGPGQERLLAHLAGCPACRDEYALLSDGVQQALTATPAVAPPAGFSGRVLAAMTADAVPADPGRVPRTRLLLVACVLLGLLAGIGGTLGVNAWVNRAPSAAPRDTVAAQLITSTGDGVGSVGLAHRDGKDYLLLNVTNGKTGTRYTCILVNPDGTRVSGGAWTLTDEYGRGEASGAWLVPITGTPPASIELVAPNGNVWARGTF